MESTCHPNFINAIYIILLFHTYMFNVKAKPTPPNPQGDHLSQHPLSLTVVGWGHQSQGGHTSRRLQHVSVSRQQAGGIGVIGAYSGPLPCCGPVSGSHGSLQSTAWYDVCWGPRQGASPTSPVSPTLAPGFTALLSRED